MARNETGQEAEDAVMWCSNNCGFFGNSATLGMCSVCYKKRATDASLASADRRSPVIQPAISQGRKKKHLSNSAELVASRKNSGPVLLDLCARNYGVAGRLKECNLRSKCHSAQQRKLVVAKGSEEPAGETGAGDLDAKLPKPAADEEPENDAAIAPNKEKETLVKCCFACHKQLPLRVLLCGHCKCGKVFCPSHRLAEHHSCNFDYQGAGRAAIAKANPMVKRDKMEERI